MNDPELVGLIESENIVIVGEITATGEKGDPGKSAYEIWIEEGNSGTPEDFLESLKSKELALSTYIYNQILATDRWEIAHNLDKYPSVSVVDTGGTLVMGDVTYIDTNNLVLDFSAEFSGSAYLN